MPTVAVSRTRASRVRRTVVAVIVVAFALSAVGGIIVLLGGDLGETGMRVVSTTAVVGAFSVAVLCCATLLDRPLRVAGAVGVAVCALTGAFVVWSVWFQAAFTTGWVTIDRLIGTGVTLSAALALACLLLLLADRRRPAIRVGLVVTLALVAVVAALAVGLIWAGDAIGSDGYWRVLGVFAILAVLGAIVVPVLSLLLPDQRPDALSPAGVMRLEDEARRRGVAPDALVDALLTGPGAPASGTPPQPPS